MSDWIDYDWIRKNKPLLAGNDLLSSGKCTELVKDFVLILSVIVLRDLLLLCDDDYDDYVRVR